MGQKGNQTKPTTETCFSQINPQTEKTPHPQNNNKYKTLRKLLRK